MTKTLAFFNNFIAGGMNVDFMLKLVLGLIMLGVGLSLKLKDFHYIRQNKSLVIIGLAIKLLLIPLLSFIALEQINIPEIFKLGILILLLSPGGTTTNVITYWFKGTAALTIFLTTIGSLVCIVSIPIFVNIFSLYYFGKESDFSLSLQTTILNIFFIIILPTIIGLLVREKTEAFAVKTEKILKPISVVLLGLFFLIKFLAPKAAGGTQISWSDASQLLPTLLIINLFSLMIGYLLPKLFRINKRDSMTIGIEMGIQNAALAILIGGTLLSNQELVKPALIYALFSFWTTTAFAFFIRLYYKKSKNDGWSTSEISENH